MVNKIYRWRTTSGTPCINAIIYVRLSWNATESVDDGWTIVFCNFLFLGQKEIWDALKAAAAATESGDNTLAQAIIDGASITLPHGKLGG